MTWLTPALAGIAAAIAVPTLIILYFLKLRRRDLEVSTTLLWKKAIQDLQANAPFQKLRRNILLILQLIALAAALVALGQPQLKGDAKQGERHVILIDRSASMQTTDEGDPAKPDSRLAEAKRQAITVVEGLREPSVLSGAARADQAMVIVFDTEAVVVQNFTSDKSLLTKVINDIEPTDAPTAIEQAVILARAHAPKRIHIDRDGSATAIEGMNEPVGIIHIFSDGRLPDADKANPGPGETVVFHRVGSDKAGNLGLVELRSERSFDNPTRLSIFAAIENGHDTPRKVDAELVIDGQIAALQSVTVPAASAAPVEDGPSGPKAGLRKPGKGGVVYRLDRPQGALVQVRLRSGSGPLEEDPFTVDDRAWLVAPPAKKLAVALVTTGSLFIREALEGLPLAKLDIVSPAQFAQKLKDDQTGEYDVVVLDGWVPPAPPVAAAAPGAPAPAPGTGLPAGRFIVFGAVPGGGAAYQLQTKGKGGVGTLIDWNRDHPVMRGLPLDSVAYAESLDLAITQGGGAVTLASNERGPAIVEIADERSRAIVIGFDPAASNWPVEWTWVVFMAQAVPYVGEEGFASAAGRAARSVRPGQALSDRLPTGAEKIELTLPEDSSTQTLEQASDGRVVWGPVRRVGPYRLTWTGTAGPNDLTAGSGRVARVYAANLLDSAESDVAASDQLTLATQVVSARDAGSAKVDRKLWPWLLLGALGVIMLEWFVYNRKVHV